MDTLGLEGSSWAEQPETFDARFMTFCHEPSLGGLHSRSDRVHVAPMLSSMASQHCITLDLCGPKAAVDYAQLQHFHSKCEYLAHQYRFSW